MTAGATPQRDVTWQRTTPSSIAVDDAVVRLTPGRRLWCPAADRWPVLDCSLTLSSGMVPEEIKNVRRVCGCNDLNRGARLANTLWVAQPVQGITHIAQEAQMNTAIGLFQTHNRWGNREICKCENGQAPEAFPGRAHLPESYDVLRACAAGNEIQACKLSEETMFKLAVITDEISQDPAVAAAMVREFGGQGLEIRSAWEKGPHELDDADIARLKRSSRAMGCASVALPRPSLSAILAWRRRNANTSRSYTAASRWRMPSTPTSFASSPSGNSQARRHGSRSPRSSGSRFAWLRRRVSCWVLKTSGARWPPARDGSPIS